MPFAPKLKVLEIPQSSAYVRLQDNTPVSALTGYGAPGGPVSYNDFVSIQTFIRYLAEANVEVPLALWEIEGDRTIVKLNYFLRDGVHLITRVLGIPCPIIGPVSIYTWAVVPGSNGYKLQCVITGSGGLSFMGAFTNVTHLKDSISPIAALLAVKGLDEATSTIELFDPYVGTAPVSLNKYYTAAVRVLVMNCGESGIIQDISNIAIVNVPLDHKVSGGLIDRILLKLAAETTFTGGNYTKAHMAAQLLCKLSTNSKPCSSC